MGLQSSYLTHTTLANPSIFRGPLMLLRLPRATSAIPCYPLIHYSGYPVLFCLLLLLTYAAQVTSYCSRCFLILLHSSTRFSSRCSCCSYYSFLQLLGLLFAAPAVSCYSFLFLLSLPSWCFLYSLLLLLQLPLVLLLLFLATPSSNWSVCFVVLLLFPATSSSYY